MKPITIPDWSRSRFLWQADHFSACWRGEKRGQRPISPAKPCPQPENLLKSACLMPRQARVVAAGVPHHITHRGNNRQDVFLSDEDRRRYQNLLRDQLDPCAIELLGWCWMTNHVHLVAIPKRPDSLAKLITRVHSRYAQAFNRRYKKDRTSVA